MGIYNIHVNIFFISCFRKAEEFILDNIMSTAPGNPSLKTAVIQGTPGSGKSCFVRHYAYKWSRQTEGQETEPQKTWSLIVILPLSTLRLPEGISTKDQILEAVNQSLYGSEVQAIMEHLENDKMKVLIIPDGIDECRNDTTLQMLKELIKQSHENISPFSVLATCRSDLCPFNLSDFERMMKTDGFTLDQGIECVKRYYDMIKKTKDSSLIEYISNSKGNLDHILNNPLMTHILCVVTTEGALDVPRGEKLRKYALLEAFEHSVTARQQEKENQSIDNDSEKRFKIDKEDQQHRFYKLCLYSLLKDITTFDNILLQKFGISDRNLYFAFMKTMRTYNRLFQKVMVWQFTHETFHEYFASCAINSLPKETLQHFLLILCSRPEFRNTQRILFSKMGGEPEREHILSDMIKATVVVTKGNSDVVETTHSLTKDSEPLQVLLPQEEDEDSHKTMPLCGQANTVQEVWHDISSCLNDHAQKAIILTNMIKDTGLTDHIYDCLHEVPEENQQRIFENSIGCLLPFSDLE